MRDNKAWGIQLRKWRQGVARSQHAFVDFLSQTNRDLSATEDRALKTIGLRERDGLTPNMLSKYELGERVPESRDRHLLLLWGLMRAGCAMSSAEANLWLMRGGQGLLAAHELALIFDDNTPIPSREAALDDVIQQLLKLLRRLNEHEM